VLWLRRLGVPILIVLVIWSLTTNGRFSGSGDQLPVLMLPIYAVATRLATLVPDGTLARFHKTREVFAYSLVGLSLICLTAWAASMLLSGLRRVTTERIAVGVVLALTLSPPVMGHAFLVFPETPAFAIVCAVVWLICLRMDELTVAKVLAVVAAVALMPWLDRKFLFLGAGLLWLIAVQHWSWLRYRSGAQWAALALIGVGTIGYAVTTGGTTSSITGMQRGTLGLLFDRERGLVSYAPVFLIVPACWAATWRGTWRVAVPALLLFLPMATSLEWAGGSSPPARYMVPMLPLFAYAAARGFNQQIVRRAAIPLLIFQVLITAYCWRHPRAMWPNEIGTNAALAAIPVIGPAYEHALPSLLAGDSVMAGWIWVVVITALTLECSARFTEKNVP